MNVFIPYNHFEFENNCDFIFQTIQELTKRKITVHLLLRYYPEFLFFRSNSFIKEKIYKQFTSSQNIFLKIFFPKTIFFQNLLYILPRRFQKYSDLESLKSIKQYILKIGSGIIWSFDQQNYDIFNLDFSKYFLKIYDCVDFYTSIDKSDARLIKNHELIQAKNSDLMFVNSNVLFKYWHTYIKIPHVKLAPQGCDISSLEKGNLLELKRIKALQLKHPVIGFIGNLDYRINFFILFKLIKMNPKYTFVLSQPILHYPHEDKIFKKEEGIKKLRTLKNIHWVSKRKRSEIAEWIKCFDIGLIPYNTKSSFVKRSYPMKLFEYFYFGLPVLSTPIIELMNFKKYLTIESSAKKWDMQLHNLLANPVEGKIKLMQRKLALKNCWSNKISYILKSTQEHRNSLYFYN